MQNLRSAFDVSGLLEGQAGNPLASVVWAGERRSELGIGENKDREFGWGHRL
jgi:hypothetical protein